MQIGQVIRKYRKEKEMTQEEMARRLGVTAPAVNKWENGSSCPDIQLLAPIARLLGITVDTLLSFREALTEEEIHRFLQEATERLWKDSYEETLQWGRKIMEEYPNSLKLILQMAVLFDAWRLTKGVPDGEQYDELILDCYDRALKAGEEEIRFQAAASLYNFYFRKGQYEKAEEYLSYYSSQDPEKKRKQADICWKRGEMEEAWKMYEELLFAGFSCMDLYLNNLFRMSVQEKDMEKARMIVERQMALARLFDRGPYQEAVCRFQLATAEKDADATMDAMEMLLENMESLTRYMDSPLYEHMEFTRPRPESIASMKETLLKSFRDDEELGYLKENVRWQAFCKQMDAQGQEENEVN